MSQQRTRGGAQFDPWSDSQDDSFYHEWPMKLSTVSGIITSKISNRTTLFNDKEVGEVNKFFQGWAQFGKQIETKWNVVTKGTDYSSLLGRGGGTHQERGPVMGDKRASIDPKAALGSLSKELAELDIDKMQTQFQKLAGDIRAKDRELEELKDTNTRLNDQLSSVMHKSVSRDESNIESISTTNRPLRLADDYKEFCTKQWMGGKEALDRKTSLSEMEKCYFLNKVLWLSYNEMNETLQRLKANVLQLINDPFLMRGNIQRVAPQHQSEQGKVKLPDDMDLAVTSYLRIQKPSYDFGREIESVLQRATSNLQQQHYSHTLHSTTRLRNYCMRACELSWLMLIQRPPMTFDMSSGVGQPHSAQEQELSFASENPSRPGVYVLYYVYPALYHGERSEKGKLLVKGTVFVGVNKR